MSIIKIRRELDRARRKLHDEVRGVVEQRLLKPFYTRRAIRRIRASYENDAFVGPYESRQIVAGVWEEQWLWSYRHLIWGDVLDMSTPRELHDYIYQLPTVDRVQISNLDDSFVEKAGCRSPVDLIGDFCAAELPVSEASFDCVLCLNILEHCSEPRAMVQNVARILRKNGIAFFMCPLAYIDGHMGDQGPDYWRFGRDGYRLLAEQAGLSVLETGEFGDLRRSLFYAHGCDASRNSWHRGIPIGNWMICRQLGRPQDERLAA